MAEGVNMGRKSPWTKEDYVSVYNSISDYANSLAAQLIQEEGTKSAAEAIAAYNVYKCPVVYLFIHYHYGMFNDLGMNSDEINAYLMLFMPSVRYFTTELRNAFASGQVFLNDHNDELASILIDMCDEIIYIEDNL